jgi:hypothetical protein
MRVSELQVCSINPRISRRTAGCISTPSKDIGVNKLPRFNESVTSFHFVEDIVSPTLPLSTPKLAQLDARTTVLILPDSAFTEAQIVLHENKTICSLPGTSNTHMV